MLEPMPCEVPFGFPFRTPPRHNATVDDMIDWIRWEGWYLGSTSWTAEYTDEEIFSLEEELPDANGFAAVNGHGAWRCPNRIQFDIDAMFPEPSYLEEHRKYVRTMIEVHQSLLPEAEAEIDRQLVQAGFRVEDYESGQEWPSSLYKKLQQLEDAKREHGRKSQIRVKVVCLCQPGTQSSESFPRMLDLYIPKTCGLVDFEGCLKQYLPHRWTDHDEDMIMQENWMDEQIWYYQVIQNGDPVEALNKGPWEGLCNPKDFTDLMAIITQDESKLAVICHQSDFPRPRKHTTPEQWKRVRHLGKWKAVGSDPGVQWNKGHQIRQGWGQARQHQRAPAKSYGRCHASC